MIEFFRILPDYILQPERFPIALLAMVLVALVGIATGPLWRNANPFLWLIIDKIFGGISARLDRRHRQGLDLFIRGLIITLVAAVFAALLGLAASHLAYRHPYGGLTEIALLSPLIAGGAVWKILLVLYRALKLNGKKVEKGAYLNIVRSTRIDLSSADDFTITRAGMGYAARVFDKGVVAPIFWYLIGGLPLAYLYAGLAALSWRFGRDGFTKGFGQTALAFEQIAGFIPHILSAFLLAVAGSLTPTGGVTRGFIGIFRRKGCAPYAEGGVPVTVMAHALKVSLGGPVQDLDGSTLKRAWVGPDRATAQLEGGHLRRALYMGWVAYLLYMAAIMGLMTALGWLF